MKVGEIMKYDTLIYFGQMIDIDEEDDDNDDGIFRCINSFCLFLLFC